MTADFDALVELAATAIGEHEQRASDWNDVVVAKIMLTAAGLPALLERVEAAEGETQKVLSMMVPHGDWQEVVDELSATEAERDALAVKVADAWDEGAIWAGAIRLNGIVSTENPYRAALTEAER